MKNPYLAARHEFESVFSNAARRARNWQLVAFITLGLLTLRIIQDGYVTATARIVPYIVEVDQFGRAQRFGPAAPLKATDRRIVIAQLAQFIRNIRTVVPDAAAQADVMRSAYAYVDRGAGVYLNSYFSDPEHDPRVLGTHLTRRVEVTSVLPLPNSNTWKVQWTETETPRQDANATSSVPRVTSWEALLTTRVVPPKDTALLDLNPLGLYVTALSWTRIGSTLASRPNPSTVVGGFL
jgi:type IV secretion system protein VirB5